ncbi:MULTISPECIES: DUF6082 family protein [unclassified Streptomyces]|uniref:DUF6082 family protein n=1 Tax=unclassified Streptomyces TaxID=2593676 RepID=UPI0033164E80
MAQVLARHGKVLALIAAGLAAVTLIASVPLLLQGVAPAGTNWGRLSDISQTYGASLSAVALLGVAAGLAYQARQTAVATEDAYRASHRQLIMMTLDDPSLMVCWEPFPTPMTPTEVKQIAFTNLIVSSWFTDYYLKRINDDALRVLLRAHFGGEIARKHWQISSSQRRQINQALGDSRALQFVTVVDEVYTQAVRSGPPTPSSAYFSTAH